MWSLVRMTAEPESQNWPRDRRGCLRDGSTVAVVACGGRWGWMWLRSRSAEWVAVMVDPLGVPTMMRSCVGLLFVQGVSSHIK